MKKSNIYAFLISILIIVISHNLLLAQTSMGNVPGRHYTSLNGKWLGIIDPFDIGIGDWRALYKDRKATGKSDFYEHSFEGGPIFDVPGDFNSQLPELKYYESSIWYKKAFTYIKKSDKRLFIHFGGVNYKADVFLNNIKIGSHEGGFTPFQFEITDSVKAGENSIIVRVNNQRIKDGIPGLGFDWFNYGGITRDVNLIETPATFIEDYFIQLQKGSSNQIRGWVKLNGVKTAQKVMIQIPELKINYTAQANATGMALIQFTANLQRWTPEQPKLYKVTINSETDTISEEIGFRTIEVKGTDILLNGKSIFLKGVNIHEEIPQQAARAYSESDALILLNWAKELGCNFVRLAHYPHNEHIVRLAERMGLMVWSELPIYQSIDFKSEIMQQKMDLMLREMIQRDKNRCGIVIWSMSNETWPSKERNEAVIRLHQRCRDLDSTRLISSAINAVRYEGNTIHLEDEIIESMDVIGVNEYLGWYITWPDKPQNMIWKSKFNKPLIMSEFGGEALYGNDPAEVKASTWSESYLEQIYKDQITMLQKIPFLRGTSPWILADFRSPVRMHPVYQDGWNRKGLLSDKGFKKKAWYVLKQFYEEKR